MHKLVARGWDTDGYWSLKPVYSDLNRNFHEVDVDHPTKVWNLKSWLKPASEPADEELEGPRQCGSLRLDHPFQCIMAAGARSTISSPVTTLAGTSTLIIPPVGIPETAASNDKGGPSKVAKQTTVQSGKSITRFRKVPHIVFFHIYYRKRFSLSIGAPGTQPLQRRVGVLSGLGVNGNGRTGKRAGRGNASTLAGVEKRGKNGEGEEKEVRTVRMGGEEVGGGKEHLLEMQVVLDSQSILIAFFSTGSHTRIVSSLVTSVHSRQQLG
ncbi:hypothetical protein B0H14DRAFT_2583349 [Mycena olivaceomarginata]|nr:hypothetical protein B0H14DRAFT_2583349 [Mycena olivaceomarginata]